MENPFDRIYSEMCKIKADVHDIKKHFVETIHPPKYLNIEQAAELLNLAVQTIYGLVHRKKIPFIKKHKRLYFKESELIKWLEDG